MDESSRIPVFLTESKVNHVDYVRVIVQTHKKVLRLDVTEQIVLIMEFLESVDLHDPTFTICMPIIKVVLRLNLPPQTKNISLRVGPSNSATI